MPGTAYDRGGDIIWLDNLELAPTDQHLTTPGLSGRGNSFPRGFNTSILWGFTT